MKILGSTRDNMAKSIDDGFGYIVQLNSKECFELYRLSQALNGYDASHYDVMDLQGRVKEVDLSQALKAINEFANIKQLVEQVKESLEELDATLMSRK